MRRALLLTTSLSTALLLTACGGDEATDPKAAYVDQAEVVCEQARVDKDALTQPTDPAGFADYADELVAVAERAQQELAALTPPPQDREELEQRVLEPFAAVVEEGRTFAGRVRDAGGDTAKLLPLLSDLPDAGDVDIEYLRSYGLDTCADVISGA